jgi:hypothetical protein
MIYLPGTFPRDTGDRVQRRAQGSAALLHGGALGLSESFSVGVWASSPDDWKVR